MNQKPEPRKEQPTPLVCTKELFNDVKLPGKMCVQGAAGLMHVMGSSAWSCASPCWDQAGAKHGQRFWCHCITRLVAALTIGARHRELPGTGNADTAQHAPLHSVLARHPWLSGQHQ